MCLTILRAEYLFIQFNINRDIAAFAGSHVIYFGLILVCSTCHIILSVAINRVEKTYYEY